MDRHNDRHYVDVLNRRALDRRYRSDDWRSETELAEGRRAMTLFDPVKEREA